MLEIAVLGYCIYFLVSIYTSFMQISFVKEAKIKPAVILDSSKYGEAGDYAVETQRVSMASTFYDFVLFFMWISFGLVTLDNFTLAYSGWQKAVIFIDLFIIINLFVKCTTAASAVLPVP
mgnify:CR=1 FL=1